MLCNSFAFGKRQLFSPYFPLPLTKRKYILFLADENLVEKLLCGENVQNNVA